ncbi:MAG: hypothetical protein ACI8Y4_005529 [Candidatus Poriferisodalaceae bacterium]|jgi:hypothetical protein
MVPIQRSANVLATGVRAGVLRILNPSVWKISSKVSMNWLPRSRTSARESASWSVWRRKRLGGGLASPSPGGVGVGAGVEDLAGGDVDEDENVVAAQ